MYGIAIKSLLGLGIEIAKAYNNAHTDKRFRIKKDKKWIALSKKGK